MEIRTKKSYVPEPLDTSVVELSPTIENVAERLAQNIHEVWAQQRKKEKWAYGPERNDERKLSPCLVPFEDLPEQEKAIDRSNAIQTLKFITAKGYTISERTDFTLADASRYVWESHHHKDKAPDCRATVYIGVCGHESGCVDMNRLTAALHDFFVSLYQLFDEADAVRFAPCSRRSNCAQFERRQHTPFVLLSPLDTNTERLACDVARGYNIPTVRIVNADSGHAEGEYSTCRIDGDVTGFICDNCLAMLAMWDGQRSTDERMESAVIRTVFGESDKINQLQLPDNHTVFHLVTPYSSGDIGLNKPYTVRRLCPYPLESGESWFYGDGENKAAVTNRYNEKRFLKNVDRIASFNRSVRDKRQKVLNRTVYDLLPGLHGNLAADRDNMRHMYTDAISAQAQDRRNAQTKAVVALAVLGLGTYALFSDMDMSRLPQAVSIAVCALFIALLVAALTVFVFQRLSRTHEDYIVFRLISESLRVQTYWKAASIDASAETQYPSRHKLDLEWARLILRSWELSNKLEGVEPVAPPAHMLNDIKRNWFGQLDEYSQTRGWYSRNNVGQFNYAKRRSKHFMKRSRWETVISVCGTIAAVALTFAPGAIVILSGAGEEPACMDVIMFLASFIQIIAAGVILFLSSRDNAELSSRYIWLSIEYQKAITAFDNAATEGADACRDILRQVGNEALFENGNWALGVIEKQPELPIG